jgi:ADP-ribose pyrophosphatase
MEEINKIEEAFVGKTLGVQKIEVDLGNGNVVNWERGYFARNRAFGSVAVVPINDKGEIILIRYYQPGSDKREFSLPGGGVKAGQTFEQAVVEEAIEEIKMRPNKITYLTTLQPIPGYLVCKTKIYLIEDLELDKSLQGDELEELEIHELSFDKALKMIETGEITDARTVAGILFVDRFRKTGN